MRCPNCNAEVLDTVNFCHNCGYDLKTYREKLSKSEENLVDSNEKNEDFAKTTRFRKISDDFDDKKYEKRDLEEDKKNEPKVSKLSKSIYEIFDVNSNSDKKSEKNEKKDLSDKKDKESKRGKRINEIFDFVDDSKSSYKYDFNPEKDYEKTPYNRDEDIESEDFEETIYVTKGYDDYEEKARRDESIRFTSPDNFTIHKDYSKNYDEDLSNTQEISAISKFQEVTMKLGSRLNKIIHPLVFNILRGKEANKKLNSVILLLMSAIPFFIYYTDVSKGQGFISKMIALLVLVGLLAIDLFQKIFSYDLGLWAATKFVEQDVEKRDRKDIARLLAGIESFITCIITLILGGSLIGFSSSIFAETFLGNHAFLYLILLIGMIILSTNTLYGRYFHKDYLKVFGTNLLINIMTRLIFFLITITLLEILLKQFVPILF